MVFEAGAWNLTSVLGVRSREDAGGAPRWLVSWEVGLRRRAGAHARAAAAALLAAALLLLAAALLPPADRAGLCAAASFTAALWQVHGDHIGRVFFRYNRIFVTQNSPYH